MLQLPTEQAAIFVCYEHPFIILWFYFTLCLLKQSDCLAYKHIECALLPMGYVVYILQKN